MNMLFKALVISVALALGYTITSLTEGLAPSSLGPTAAAIVTLIVMIVGVELVDKHFPRGS